MKSLKYETLIDCSVEQLYAFHANPANLPLITPPGTSVTILAMPQSMTEGSQAKLHIRRGMIGFRWALRFEKVDPPYCIVDVAERSPFAAFRHAHHFQPLDTSHAILRDEVTFALPLGWVGRWFEPLVARDLKTMFSYRHVRTKSLLEHAPRS